MKMQSKFISSNGIQLHFLDSDSSNSNQLEPILFIHGLTANSHAFDAIFQNFLAEKYRFISVDLRGRGLSDQPSTGYTMLDHAKDIVGMLDNLDITSIHIVGHSFGGFLGLYLAIYYPAMVKKLVLLDAAVNMHPNTKEMLVPALGRLGKTFDSFDDYINKVKQAPYLSFWDEAMLSYYKADVFQNADGTVTPRSKPEHMMEAVLKGSLGMPWGEIIGLCKQETILINAPGIYNLGAALLPEELAKETANLLSNAKYEQVSGNHQTMLYGESAKQIAALIQSFIK
ncbi:alpha/beta fold hydrolase [Sediminibacterium sp.]|uniref:alpha/beta fold hydrolase n=2 Tax=Sediminibacterium sp. TaxID=1917865 RepID=UPI0027367C8D|nr:alpha/beta hydrolase [Sediminibacterium sp.]MDP3394516.1 alpha/beta hydrolase [Sediminibacterium sp.]MDP3568351.1 alpha/beta hydrolase [Sediminibacterium sp.]